MMANQNPHQTPTRASVHSARNAVMSMSSPKLLAAHNERTPTQRNLNSRNVVNSSREVVSDVENDTDNEDDAGLPDSDDHDMDEPDAFALPGAKTSRLTGQPPKFSISLQRQESGASALSDAPTPSDASHDDDYDAVDAMSDGGDSEFDAATEEALLKASERDLIKEFKKIEKKTDQRSDPADPWSMIASPDFTAVEPNIDFGKDPFLGLSPQDPAHQAMWNEAEGDLAAWRLPAPTSMPSEQSQVENGELDEVALHTTVSLESAVPDRRQKRVRFRRPSSVSSDEDPAEAYPDLMDSAASGRLYPPINNFSDPVQVVDYDSSDDSADEYICATTFSNSLQTAESFLAESDSDEDSSDTDSDDGDTTDEEVVGYEEERKECIRVGREKLQSTMLTGPPSTPNAAKKSTRPAVSRQGSDSSSKLSNSTNGQPRTRVFRHDPSRAALSLGKDGVKLQSPSNPPEKDRAFWERARRAMGPDAASPSGSVTWKRSEPRAAKAPPKPFTCNQTLGNIFDGNLPVPEPLVETLVATSFPDAMIVDQWEGASEASEDASLADDDSQADSAFNMNDMVDFGLCTTESDLARPVSAGILSQADSTISSPVAAHSNWDHASIFEPEVDAEGNTLSHLSQQPNLVASFRINQDRARAVGSLAINPIRRMETSERNAIQSSRRGAENLPFSPARRRRISQDLTGAGVSKSPRTPRRGRGASFVNKSAAAVELQRMASEGTPVAGTD